jgi:hypothetical protein
VFVWQKSFNKELIGCRIRAVFPAIERIRVFLIGCAEFQRQLEDIFFGLLRLDRVDAGLVSY